MHADRRKIIGLMQRLSAAGDGHRYAEPMRLSRLSDFIRDWASKNSWFCC